MDWRWGDRAAATLLVLTMLIATAVGYFAVGYFKGEHAMLVVLSIGMMAFLCAAFEDLRGEFDKLRDELRRTRQ
jgi:hypothetical protein